MNRDSALRSNSIDSMKTIAAVLVVVQHALGVSSVPSIIVALSRTAVPVFMMITGFFYIDVVKKNKQKRQIKKFIVIALIMTALYFSIDFLTAVLKGETKSFILSLLSVNDIINFFVFQNPVFADHAWYMWSMIVVLVSVMFFPAIYKNKVIRYTIITAGIISTLVFGKYSLLIFGTDISPFYTRTAWSVGFPYFLLGICLAEKKDVFSEIKPLECRIFSAVSAVLLLIERMILMQTGFNGTRDTYLFLPIFSVSLFIMMYNSEFMKKSKKLSFFGLECSLIMYIIHPIFVRVEVRLFDMSSWQRYAGCLFVIIVSIIASVTIKKIYIKIYSLKRKGVHNGKDS